MISLKMANPRSRRTFSDSKKLNLFGPNKRFIMILFIFTLVQLLPITFCQDFEDLNKQTTAGNFQLPQQFTFTSSRQPQLQSTSANTNNLAANPLSSAAVGQQVSGTNSLRQSQAPLGAPTRPILSSRFSPQGLSAQASSSATTFASPLPSSAGGNNNAEQPMKNALTRTTRIEAESRQDRSPEAIPQSRSGQIQLTPAQQQTNQQVSPTNNDRIAESSETSTNTQLARGDDEDKATTAAQTTTTNGHETVYSDQRFANLFARRNVGKKARLNPTEQVKAKPTLPSFIKSPPDPKQFTATIQDRPSSVPISSARLQLQQNQPKIGSPIGQPKKVSAITSSSAANANNRRNNALNNKPANISIAPKAAASNAKATQATTSKPVALNNPFNRQNNNNSNDPANVIAMARKRLLANNAIESAKLKQQKPSK